MAHQHNVGYAVQCHTIKVAKKTASAITAFNQLQISGEKQLLLVLNKTTH